MSPITIIAALRPGVIAVIMEAISLTMGLFTAWNLKAIVALNARRRLLRKGRAKLRDLTCGKEILDSIAKPRLLLNDWRSTVFSLLLLTITVLDILAVLQTQPGEKCDFQKAGSFTVEEKLLECLDAQGNQQCGFQYLDQAKIALRQADLDTGVPVNTDVFESSVLSKASVEALRPFEDRFNVPLMKRWTTDTKVSSQNISVGVFKSVLTRPSSRRSRSRVQWWSGDMFRIFGGIFPWLSDGSVGHTCEEGGSFQVSPHVSSWRINKETNASGIYMGDTSTGIIAARACQSEMWVFVCLHERRLFFPYYKYGRAENLKFPSAYVPDPLSRWNETFATEKFAMKCDTYAIHREGRYTSPNLRSTDTELVVKILSGEDATQISSSVVRRAMLTAIVAQNSAARKPCKRFIAVPKHCTQVGWVSLAAFLTLAVLLLASIGGRLALTYLLRGSGDWNSDWRRLGESVFNQFSPKVESEAVLDKCGDGMLDDELHVSVVESTKNAGSYRLIWSRGRIWQTPMKKVGRKDVVGEAGEEDDASSEIPKFCRR